MMIPKRFKNCWTSYRFFMFIITKFRKVYKIFRYKWWHFSDCFTNKYMINFIFFTIGTCISFLGLSRYWLKPPKPIYSRSLAVIVITASTSLAFGISSPLSQLLHRFRCHYCHQPHQLWNAFWGLEWLALFGLCQWSFLLCLTLLTLLGAAVLAIYDLRFMEFLWSSSVASYPGPLFCPGSNLLMLVFLLLASYSSFFFYRWGADFLLLPPFQAFLLPRSSFSFRSHPS